MEPGTDEGCVISPKNSTKHDRKLGKKLNRCRHLLLKHEGLKPSYNPTKHLFVANGGLLNQIQHHEIADVFGQHPGLEVVAMVPGKPYSFVSYSDSSSAMNAVQYLQGYQLHDEEGPQRVVLYLLYINNIPGHVQTRPSDVSPPGLILVPEFIDDATEQKLLTSLKWEVSSESLQSEQILKQRKVQHYGYRFCYNTNDVDRANPLPGGFGSLYRDVANSISASGLVKYHLDQLTVNQYQPGHGIPSHVDTHSAFEDTFCSLSLGSQVLMLFTHPNGHQVPVLIPPRSLLVLSGEARYLWSHGITARKSDVVASTDSCKSLTVVPRGTRTSFTFRSVKWTACKCRFPERCDSQGYVKKSELIKTDKCKVPVALPTSEKEAATLEADHVHTVYENIALHFSETRYRTWPPVAEFINDIPIGSIMLDVGCGNGKYLGVNADIFKVGCDRSRNLLGICREKSYQAFVCDSLALPVRSQSVDVCICVAVLHHFTTQERRLQGLLEILRVLRPGGRALITVWALEQEKNNKKSTYLKSPSVLRMPLVKRATTAESNQETHGSEMHDGQEGKLDAIEEDKRTANTEPSDTSTSNETVDTVSSALNIHLNRTQFKQQDMLVPWHFKKPGDKLADQAEFEVYHRFYHVFVEGELESLCHKLPNVEVERCYHVEGNWFIIIRSSIECATDERQ